MISVYIWHLIFIENCGDSGGSCMATAYDKDQAIEKILSSFEKIYIVKHPYYEGTGLSVDNVSLQLKSVLQSTDPCIVSIEEFVQPPSGTFNFEPSFNAPICKDYEYRVA